MLPSGRIEVGILKYYEVCSLQTNRVSFLGK